jgi:hypothetical protein
MITRDAKMHGAVTQERENAHASVRGILMCLVVNEFIEP